jgi:hypothetical protein
MNKSKGEGHRAKRARTTNAPRKTNATRSLLPFLALFLALSLCAACGKRRPPEPPVERVPQRTELLSGAQRGNEVILSWPAPRRNASDGSVQSIRRVDVYRVAERPNDPLPLTEDEFASRSTLIGSVTYEEIQRSGDTLAYTDTLTLTEPVRLRYAVRYVNAAGQRAAFSNFLLIEPASTVSQPPTLLDVTTPAENTVRVRWDAPKANVDNSTPINLLGYNVYRTDRSQTGQAQTPLNPAPINATQFNDQTFKFGEEYSYVVRAVSLGTGGSQVESLNSNSLTVTPRDLFPPIAPTGLSINAGPQRISLFFAANPERDVVGYNIFRSNDASLPRDQWRKLTRTPTDRTTYNDDAVEPGVIYYYYVTAVDSAGNTSAPSEVVSDQIRRSP